jgi:5-(carboxyamino)imidazole ribonucleotide mutase
MSQASGTPLVGVIMGSKSDWEIMRHTADVLAEFGVPHESRVVSAHRTPHQTNEWASTAKPADCRSSLPRRRGSAFGRRGRRRNRLARVRSTDFGTLARRI